MSRSGNLVEFIDMVQRCKRAGVGIIADAVTNHMAAGRYRPVHSFARQWLRPCVSRAVQSSQSASQRAHG